MKVGLLLSGGVESTALAYWKRPNVAYTIDYGQTSAAAEVEAARWVSKRIKCRHEVIKVDASKLGTGPLARRKASPLSAHEEWWPFRNQLLLTLAGMRAVQEGIGAIMIGTTRLDNRHADGRPEFVVSMNRLMARQEGCLQVIAPAWKLTPDQLLTRAKLPAGILLNTFSCHHGAVHCGHCPGCHKRLTILSQRGLA